MDNDNWDESGDNFHESDAEDEDEEGDCNDDENHQKVDNINNQTDEMNLEDEEEEDWTSDDYWEPNQPISTQPNHKALWASFVHKCMSEGHFCPADMHAPIIYNQRMPAKIEPGQFDDASSDDENEENKQNNQRSEK